MDYLPDEFIKASSLSQSELGEVSIIAGMFVSRCWEDIRALTTKLKGENRLIDSSSSIEVRIFYQERLRNNIYIMLGNIHSDYVCFRSNNNAGCELFQFQAWSIEALYNLTDRVCQFWDFRDFTILKSR